MRTLIRSLLPGADGKLPAVGNTVDIANAKWTNTIGVHTGLISG